MTAVSGKIVYLPTTMLPKLKLTRRTPEHFETNTHQQIKIFIFLNLNTRRDKCHTNSTILLI